MLRSQLPHQIALAHHTDFFCIQRPSADAQDVDVADSVAAPDVLEKRQRHRHLGFFSRLPACATLRLLAGLEPATCSAAVPPPAALVATSETGSAASSFPAKCTSASTALMATTEYGSIPCSCSVGTAETGSAAGSFPAECTSSSTALMATGESDSTHLLRVPSVCENHTHPFHAHPRQEFWGWPH